MKKILIILFILLVSITPISALTIPQDAYQVPWLQSDYYIITNNNGILTAFVSDQPLAVETVELQQSILFRLDHKREFYQFTNNQWQQLAGTNWSGSSTLINGIHHINWWNTNIPRELSRLTNNIILNSNFDVPTRTSILFQQAPFQLQLTPLEQSLTGAQQTITRQFGTILLVGLAILSTLLAIRLVPRLARWVIR